MSRISAEDWLAQWNPSLSRELPRCSERPSRPRTAREGQSLAEKVPLLAAEWDSEANGSITPWSIGASSNFVAWWICPRNAEHRWKQSVNQRAHTDHGKRCPWCEVSYQLAHRRSTSERLVDKIIRNDVTFSERNPVALEEAAGGDWLDWLWVCENGHEFVASPVILNGGFSCATCWARKKSDDTVSQKAKIGGVFKLDKPMQRSKEEIRLAAELSQVFFVDFDHDAIRTRGYLFNKSFVTPDVILPEQRAVVEWDGGGHRLDPEVDLLKEQVLLETGWTTIRASVHVADSSERTIAAPRGLTLAVVGSVMDRLLDFDPTSIAHVEQWRRAKRWQGGDVYEEMVKRAGRSAQFASAWRRR